RRADKGTDVFIFDGFLKDAEDVEFYFREFCYKDFNFDAHKENVEKKKIVDIDQDDKKKDFDKHYKRSPDFDEKDDKKDFDFGDKFDFDFDGKFDDEKFDGKDKFDKFDGKDDKSDSKKFDGKGWDFDFKDGKDFFDKFQGKKDFDKDEKKWW
ncbi:hypothetical protein JCM6882_006329, partial [Rhodosporidiobolus microsporus]